jgi:hypothetical protein
MSEDNNNKPQVLRDPLTPKQIKGLDLVVKGVSKKFPYIVGWEKSEVFEKYQTQMFIDLIVDMTKLSEYFDKSIKYYWVEDLEVGRRDFGGGIYFLNDNDDVENVALQNKKIIESRIDESFKLLPKEFQVWITWTSPSYMLNADGSYYQSISTIDVSSYFCKIF